MASATTTGHPQGAAGTQSPIGWTPPGDLDAGGWASAGRRIGAVSRCIQWLLGDWLVYGNSKFGERYSRAAKITGYDTQTLMNMAYVASRFPISRRREILSWSHHESLAALEPEEQELWLGQATDHRWSVADLRMMVRLSRREEAAEGDEVEAEESEGAKVAVVTCPHCGSEVPVESS
jgi:hypothetical protein